MTEQKQHYEDEPCQSVEEPTPIESWNRRAPTGERHESRKFVEFLSEDIHWLKSNISKVDAEILASLAKVIGEHHD